MSAPLPVMTALPAATPSLDVDSHAWPRSLRASGRTGEEADFRGDSRFFEPDAQVEQRELLSALQTGAAERLTPHQRAEALVNRR